MLIRPLLTTGRWLGFANIRALDAGASASFVQFLGSPLQNVLARNQFHRTLIDLATPFERLFEIQAFQQLLRNQSPALGAAVAVLAL